MHRDKRTRGETALYVWDYFYITRVPARGDEEVWRVIERAVCRIHESETMLDPPRPPDVRLRHARRVRNAARLARRKIALLSTQPEPWVVEGLLELEATAGELIRTLSAEATGQVVN